MPQAGLAEVVGWAFFVPSGIFGVGLLLLLAAGCALGAAAPRTSVPA